MGLDQVRLRINSTLYQQKIIIKMEKVAAQRLHYLNKQNDCKKGNKNNEMDVPLMQKWFNNQKLYQSVSSSIQLRPTFLKKKPTSNTSQFCSLYGEQLLRDEKNNQASKRFLMQHEIDSHLRAKMIDWMIEVTTSYRFTNKTFFDGISIMDRYFQAETDSLSPSKLHLIGVQCMLIASKMNQVYPLKIKTVFQKIGHRKLPMDDLANMQEQIMKKLDYKLNSWTFFDLALVKLSEYHAYEEQRRQAMGKLYFSNEKDTNMTSQDRLKRMEDLCSFICKHLMFDYDFLCENTMMAIAQACVKGVLEIMDISSNPVCFYSTSPITLELTKQKIFKIMKKFKNNFANLNNIFKFTSDEVLTQVGEFSN